MESSYEISDPNVVSWVTQVSNSLNDRISPFWEKRSIYRVPAIFGNLNCDAYRPRLVSFGPYHHGEDRLRPMEDHKNRVLVRYLMKSGKTVSNLVNSLRNVAGDAQASYDELDPKWKEGRGDRFLQLMITDGCFLLEFLRTAVTKYAGYEANDPIFGKHGEVFIFPFIWRDMLLLENQVPMVVLDQLVLPNEDAKTLILKFFSREHRNEIKKGLHVLDVFRKSMLMEPGKKKQAVHSYSDEVIRSATELREHGIRFEKSDTDILEDITFASGVLRLPNICVDENTESMFLNLTAFERSHVGAGAEVSSYIYFMDTIIDKGQDVALLHNKGIIKSVMESDEAAAKLFNTLANGVVFDPESNLNDVVINVREYCKKRRHQWRANLIHTYFRNPWVILSLIAAILLFTLTIIQTVYSVLGYNK